MSADQLNILVLALILGVSALLAVIVGVLSSHTLRDEGLRHLIKRWLGR